MTEVGCWMHYPDSGVIRRSSSDGSLSAGLIAMNS
jgi:hypothetical protein